MTEGTRFLEFGRFRLDRRERLLYSAGEAVPLPPKADPFVWDMRTDSAFDPLRGDPRYRELLAKLNL